MILTFIWPSSAQYTGGVVALYEFANALSRRGHDVHFVHGPASPHRIGRLEELDWFTFHHEVTHHLVDTLEDSSLPAGDVVFSPYAPSRLGLPAVLLQGYGMVPADLEHDTFRLRGLKICVAQWLVEIGIRYGSPRDQLVHVPCGIDHDLFRVTTPLDERPVDVAVLFNAHPAKAWPVACETLAAVRERRPDLTVEVFGILPPEDPLPDWMRFQRGLDREHLVTGIYNRSKVFLQPSWFEGFGFTAVEAMASGCALVTTDNGGSLDYALPGETALVAPPGDTVGLAAAVEDLLVHDDRRQALAAAGETYVRRFTWERVGLQAEAHLERYVADPDRYRVAPGPSLDPAPPPLSRDPFAPAVARAPGLGRVPSDEELVFNVVWTGVVYRVLLPFVLSQMDRSRARFRFVANGCHPDEVAHMERFQAEHADRVVEVLVVSTDDMVAHGVALDRVRAQRHDGDLFCLIDPDIKATAPFVADFAALTRTADVVTSGKELWNDDNVVPTGSWGVAGEHFFDQDGFVFGSPHLAIYRRAALDEVCERWGVGLGSAGPELREATSARLLELGRTYRVYDTAKIVNILLQGDGHPLVHQDLDHLIHIGGLAHFISPPAYRTTDQGEQEPDWTLYPEMATRHAVTRYTADLLQRLAEGGEAPPEPPDVDPSVRERLSIARREIIDLMARYGADRPASEPRPFAEGPAT